MSYPIQWVIASAQIAILGAFLWRCSLQIGRAVDHLVRQAKDLEVIRKRLVDLEDARDEHDDALSAITSRIGHLPVPGERGNPGK